MHRPLLVLTLGIIVVLSVSAQEIPAAQKDTVKTAEVPFYELDEVVVTTPRTTRPILRVPMAIDVVSAEEIQRAQATVAVGEIFRSLPGIAMDNRYNPSTGERLVIRGSGSRGQFAVRGTKIFLDGIPLTTADGSTILTALSPGMIARAEVIRGPASSLYGNASNGVINLTSATGWDMPLSVQLKSTTGSYGLWKWEALTLGKWNSTAYALNVDRTTSDGFRQRSESELTRASAQVAQKLSETMQLRALFNYYRGPYLLNPGGLTKAEISTDRLQAASSYFNAGSGRNTSQGTGGLNFQYDDLKTQSLDATLFFYRKDQLLTTPPDISDGIFRNLGARTLYRKQFTFMSMPAQWSAGVEYERYTEEMTRHRNLLLPPDKRGTTSPDQVMGLVRRDTVNIAEVNGILSGGAFTELELTLTPKWILLLGGRFDTFKIYSEDRLFSDGEDDSGERTLSNFSPSVGLLYRLSQYSSVYSNIATGFQMPTLSEVRNAELGLGGINLSLEPEKVTSIEAGIRGVLVGAKLAYDLSLFYADYHDMLIPYQGQAGGNVFYRNAGRALNLGGEAKIQWEPLNGLKTSFAMTAMDFKFKDFIVQQRVSGVLQEFQLKENKVPGVSPIRLYIGAVYRHSSGVFSEVNMRWVDEMYVNDYNGTIPGTTAPASDFLNPSYMNVDARVGFTQKIATLDVELFAGVNNVLDASYNASVIPNAVGNRYYEPSPGRNWYSGVRILFTALK